MSEKGKEMLRTNTKKARQNLQYFIMHNLDPKGYGYDDNITNFKEAAAFIRERFYEEKYEHDKRLFMNHYDLFREWAQGLACCDLFDYYLYRDSYNAIEALGDILEETDEERNRFTHEEASEKLTQLIYREVYR